MGFDRNEKKQRQRMEREWTLRRIKKKKEKKAMTASSP